MPVFAGLTVARADSRGLPTTKPNGSQRRQVAAVPNLKSKRSYLAANVRKIPMAFVAHGAESADGVGRLMMKTSGQVRAQTADVATGGEPIYQFTLTDERRQN